MVFGRLLGAFGVGGPSVETVLATSRCRPGEYLPGEVRLRGGDSDVFLHQVVLSLVTQVETEHDDHDGVGTREFHRGAITGGFHLPAGQHHSIPFQVPVPWELPITEVYGQHLHGMAMGVRTELEVAGQLDKGDLDPISVSPLPSQQRVLDAFAELGFVFKAADIEEGHIAGVHQELPFYQEIEFYAPSQYGGQISEVELTFVTGPHELTVVLEADRRSDLFTEGGDSFGRFRVDHQRAMAMSWEHELSGWLQAVAGHLNGGHASDGHSAFAHGGDHGVHGHTSYGHHSGSDHHAGHGGPGWGGVAAGAAGGLAAGFVAGAVANELLDGDADDNDEGDGEAAEAAAEAAYQAAYTEAVQDAVDEAYEDAYEEAYEDAYEEAAEEAAEVFESEED